MIKRAILLLGLSSLAILAANADPAAIETTTSTVTEPNTAVITSYRTVITTNVDDPNQILFAGQPMGCTKPTEAGDPDCCSTTGWSSSALNLCTAEERALATARNAGVATYVGDTCIQSNGNCQAPMQVYCVFPDEVSFQVQVQGRKQLGIDFGTPAAPNCQGLTLDQVRKIDLTQITFGGTSNAIPAIQSNS